MLPSMTIAAALVPSGLHHAKALGPITVGPGPGEVPAVGPGQLMILPLPFSDLVYRRSGFENQTYVISKSLDGNVTNIVLDAVQFQYDPITGQPALRLLVDVTAVPAQVDIWIEAHHSAGR